MARIDLFQPNFSTSTQGIILRQGRIFKSSRKLFQVKGKDAQGRSVIQTLKGSFKYDKRGRLSGGTIKEISISYNGITQWSVSGVSLSVSQYEKISSSGTRARSFFPQLLTGNDIIRGSKGADGIFAYAGNDTALGGAGNDTIDGGQGNDILDRDTSTGRGNDSLVGGGGNDTLFAFNDDTIDGGEGDDLIRVWSDQAYVLQGGGGKDRIEIASDYWITGSFSLGANGIEEIDGNGGFILGTAAGDALDFSGITLTGVAFIDGSGGDDAITGSFSGDDLRGGSGNDTLDGGAGADAMAGGDGDDLYIVDDLSDTATEAGGSGSGIDTVRASVSFTLGTNLENLVLTGVDRVNGSGNDLANAISGNDAANSLSGAAGNDSLSGGAGADTLDGGTGADAMAGGDGDDLYIVDDLSDTATEAGGSGSGIDTVRASVSFTLGTNLENLVLTGVDRIDGSGNELANAISGNDAANSLNGAAGNDSLSGGAGADTLDGGNGSDSLDGGDGDDLLEEGEGDDTLSGGAGNDELFSGNGSDLLDGGDGDDYIEEGEGDDTLIGGAGNDELFGGNGSDLLDGGDGDDYIEEGEGDDTLIGGAGNDTLFSGNGSDSLDGGDGDDLLVEGEGDDTLIGGAGNDELFGGNGSDLLDGGDGDDYIEEGEGDDTLIGGAGNDELFGGNGSDSLDGGNGSDYLDGGPGDDELIGGEGNDTIILDSLNDTVIIGERGGRGDDLYILRVGNQLAPVTAGADDPGNDTVEIGEVNPNLFVSLVDCFGVENLLLKGSKNVAGTGSDLDNILIGNDGDNALLGGIGNDTLAGGLGNDTLIGGAGSDSIIGGVGADILRGDDTFSSGSASDTFVTRQESSPAPTNLFDNDSISSGVGNGDQITFSNGVDYISDFGSSQDRIDFQGASAPVLLSSILDAEGRTSLAPDTAYKIRGEWDPSAPLTTGVFTVGSSSTDVDYLFFVTNSSGGAWATGATGLIGTQSLILDNAV